MEDMRHTLPTVSLSDTDRIVNGGTRSRLSDRHITIDAFDDEKEDVGFLSNNFILMSTFFL